MAFEGQKRRAQQCKRVRAGHALMTPEGLQQLKALCEMTNRFDMRRALNGTLASPLPVWNGLLCQTRLCVVLCQEFGPRLSHLWELLFQHLRNVCMVLLPHTPY